MTSCRYQPRTSGVLAVCLFFALPTFAEERVDRDAINRIIDQAFNHSELAETAAYLSDRIGGRLTNSPQMRAAEQWTQDRYREWGLENVRAEGFDFGRGWSIEQSSVRMLTPRRLQLRAIPVAWTPPTRGALRAPIIVAPLGRECDFEQWRGRLAGKIVLISRPDEGSEPDKAPFKRLSTEELDKLGEYEQPRHSTALREKYTRMRTLAAKRDAFLAAEGALAWVRKSRRDGGLMHGEGYCYKRGQTAALPGMELAAEDYRRLARLAKAGPAPTLEIVSDVRFHDGDTSAYNILAELTGRETKAGYVMAGAHLDSWVAADGAQDNAAGSAVIMEAARILAKIGVKPKRAIRFALWSGEEQGSLGSLAYVERYLATRPRDTSSPGINEWYTWLHRWPITKRAGHAALSAYFNIDSGSGKVRGIYTEGNVAVMPIFSAWLAPFASMGATTVSPLSMRGTDHMFMHSVGIPAFSLIQDPLDYGSRAHHTSLDTYDHLKIADLRQAAAVMASLLLSAAESNDPLPRMPLPAQPRETDPFAYEDEKPDAVDQ